MGRQCESSEGNKWPVLWVQRTLSVTSSRCFYKLTTAVQRRTKNVYL